VPYFDATNQEHLKLLPEGIRTDGDLANIAADAEADVIGHYTERGGAVPSVADPPILTARERYQLTDAQGNGIGVYVYLKGYDPDPAQAEQNLVTAMRRAIAAVIRWRRAQRDKDPLHASEAGDAGTFSGFSYRKDAENTFPPGFSRYLRHYDTRRPLESI